MFDGNPSADPFFQTEKQDEVKENIMIVLEDEVLELKEVREGNENVVEERVVLDPEEKMVLEG